MRRHALVLAATATAIATLRASEKPPESYVKLMKETNTTAQALRAHVPAKDYDAIAADAAALEKLFGDVETFWTARRVDDAVASAKKGVRAAADLQAAAQAKNEEGIANAARTVNMTCMGCHYAHRQRFPDGSSEIK